MQIGISSASLYPQQPTESALVNIAALGCKRVEVFLQTRREYRTAYVRKLSRLAANLGMVIPSLHAASSQYEPMLFYSYRRQILDGFDTLNWVLAAAAELGAERLVFHGPLRVEDPDRDRILHRLRMVAATAAARGIKLALENVSWCLGWSPEVFRWLQKEAIPNLYYTFDSKQALRSGFAPGEYLAAMAGDLSNVHLSDGRGGIPLEGRLDEIAALLKAGGYAGPVILEVYGTKVQDLAHLGRGWEVLKRTLQ